MMEQGHFRQKQVQSLSAEEHGGAPCSQGRYGAVATSRNGRLLKRSSTKPHRNSDYVSSLLSERKVCQVSHKFPFPTALHCLSDVLQCLTGMSEAAAPPP